MVNISGNKDFEPFWAELDKRYVPSALFVRVKKRVGGLPEVEVA